MSNFHKGFQDMRIECEEIATYEESLIKRRKARDLGYPYSAIPG